VPFSELLLTRLILIVLFLKPATYVAYLALLPKLGRRARGEDAKKAEAHRFASPRTSLSTPARLTLLEPHPGFPPRT
jgi:hypothetical protein